MQHLLLPLVVLAGCVTSSFAGSECGLGGVCRIEVNTCMSRESIAFSVLSLLLAIAGCDQTHQRQQHLPGYTRNVERGSAQCLGNSTPFCVQAI